MVARTLRREGYGFRLGHPGIEKNGQHGRKVALHSLVAPRQTEEPLIAENFDCPRVSGWPSSARSTQKEHQEAQYCGKYAELQECFGIADDHPGSDGQRPVFQQVVKDSLEFGDDENRES